MNTYKYCCFCNKEATLRNGYYVCESCKTVCFLSNNSDKCCRKQIADYLQKMQTFIERDQELLHDLEQHSMSDKKMSDKELNFLNTIKEFSSIKIDLEFLLENGYSLSEEKIRQLLYKLLLLSEKFKNDFGGRYNG